MLLKNIDPFIRFADTVNYSITRGTTKTYDCRFIYVLDGNGKINIENTEYTVSEGTLIIFQPGTAYRIDPMPVFNFAAIDFDYVQDYNSNASILPPIQAINYNESLKHRFIKFEDQDMFNYPIVTNALYIHKSILEILEEFNSKKLFHLEKTSLMLKNIFFEIARNFVFSNKAYEICSRALNYIYSNYNKPISNNDIAKHLNIDSGYLNKLFKGFTGMTMHKYLIDYRINIASKLLITSNMSLESISYTVGFYNLAHFSSAFKSKTGHSPSDFRRGK